MLAFHVTPTLASPLAAASDALLKLETNLWVWTLIIFFALLVILWRGGWKMMITKLDARDEAIRGAIDKAKLDREEAERLLQEQKADLDKTRRETAEMLQAAQQEAARERQRIIDGARDEYEKIVQRGREQIQNETRAALSQVRQTVADLSLDVQTYRSFIPDPRYLEPFEVLGLDGAAPRQDARPAGPQGTGPALRFGAGRGERHASRVSFFIKHLMNDRGQAEACPLRFLGTGFSPSPLVDLDQTRLRPLRAQQTRSSLHEPVAPALELCGRILGGGEHDGEAASSPRVHRSAQRVCARVPERPEVVREGQPPREIDLGFADPRVGLALGADTKDDLAPLETLHVVEAHGQAVHDGPQVCEVHGRMDARELIAAKHTSQQGLGAGPVTGRVEPEGPIQAPRVTEAFDLPRTPALVARTKLGDRGLDRRVETLRRRGRGELLDEHAPSTHATAERWVHSDRQRHFLPLLSRFPRAGADAIRGQQR